MPTNRTRRSRLWQAKLDDYRRQQLLDGPDAVLLAGVGYLAGLTTATFEAAPIEDRARILADMEADWRQHREALLAWWNEGERADPGGVKPWTFVVAGGPDRLPWAAQQFDNQGERE